MRREKSLKAPVGPCHMSTKWSGPRLVTGAMEGWSNDAKQPSMRAAPDIQEGRQEWLAHGALLGNNNIAHSYTYSWFILWSKHTVDCENIISRVLIIIELFVPGILGV